ncbi:hypothetical protein [Labilibaculum antarcticum]|uniref:hypothetical protein n=1 Tax=Labilibaculum antarcticum TaxID=1717717 RepID=UPI001293F5FD|nr:hypothetical protein [Labilibaculum antarcticum]
MRLEIVLNECVLIELRRVMSWCVHFLWFVISDSVECDDLNCGYDMSYPYGVTK